MARGWLLAALCLALCWARSGARSGARSDRTSTTAANEDDLVDIPSGLQGPCAGPACNSHCKAQGHPEGRCTGSSTCTCRGEHQVGGRCLFPWMCKKKPKPKQKVVLNKNIIKVYITDAHQHKKPDREDSDDIPWIYDYFT